MTRTTHVTAHTRGANLKTPDLKRLELKLNKWKTDYDAWDAKVKAADTSNMKRFWSKFEKDLYTKDPKAYPYMNEHYGMEEVPPEVVEKLILERKHPFNDVHNDSPTTDKMVRLLRKHGGTLEGGKYENGYDFDGFTINMTSEQANELKRAFKITGNDVNEFQRVAPNKYRFWWD